MRNNFIILLVCLSSIVFSQDCFKIGIQKSDKEYKNLPYYFTHVIDGRADSSNTIGEVYLGSINILQCAELKSDLKSSLLTFLQKTYTNKSAPAYLIKVNELKIQEQIRKGTDDIGKASAQMEFYKFTPDADLIFITKISKSVQDIYPDVTYSHDNRLKRLIMLSVNEFDAVLKTDTNLFTLKPSTTDIKQLKHKISDTTNTSKTTITKESGKFLIQAQCHFGLNTKGLGLRIGSYFFLKNSPKFGIGPSIFWNYFTLNKNVVIPSNVVELRYNLWNAGIMTFSRLNQFIGIAIDGWLLMGTEKVTTNTVNYVYFYSPIYGYGVGQNIKTYTTKDIVGGVHFEQGIQFMRGERRGVNAKFSIYETFLSSGYFEKDLGIKLSCGLNF